MSRNLVFVLLLATSVALADDAPKEQGAAAPAAAPEKKKEEAPAPAQDDANLGMSILGNQEAPKALVIVPWKRSELGNAAGISTLLDDSRLPIDKEVFMRMLGYYEIRSETAHHGGVPAAGRTTAPAEKSHAAQPAPAASGRTK